jgi:hypothetical protein
LLTPLSPPTLSLCLDIGSTEKDVKKLVSQLNIQFDNLCQFLPQVTRGGGGGAEEGGRGLQLEGSTYAVRYSGSHSVWRAGREAGGQTVLLFVL